MQFIHLRKCVLLTKQKAFCFDKKKQIARLKRVTFVKTSASLLSDLLNRWDFQKVLKAVSGLSDTNHNCPKRVPYLEA